MKDKFNNTISIGDTVVYMGTSKFCRGDAFVGKVIARTSKMIRIKVFNKTARAIVNKDQTKSIYPDKCIVITDEIKEL